jgi:Tfp pilus assembly PilM family ATPase
VNEVVLSGPGAHDENLAAELSSRVAMPVSVAEPLGSLGTHAVPSGDDPFRYTVAAGLALGEAA